MIQMFRFTSLKLFGLTLSFPRMILDYLVDLRRPKPNNAVSKWLNQVSLYIHNIELWQI